MDVWNPDVWNQSCFKSGQTSFQISDQFLSSEIQTDRHVQNMDTFLCYKVIDWNCIWILDNLSSRFQTSCRPDFRHCLKFGTFMNQTCSGCLKTRQVRFSNVHCNTFQTSNMYLWFYWCTGPKQFMLRNRSMWLLIDYYIVFFLYNRIKMLYYLKEFVLVKWPQHYNPHTGHVHQSYTVKYWGMKSGKCRNPRA